MRRYNKFTYERDFKVPQNPHLYYLLGRIDATNTEYVLASYSTKTKRLIVKDAASFDFQHPYGVMLNNFIEKVEKYDKEHPAK
ncbi:MAG: hypothetical protein IJE43_14150 [Alphaproteobacteria bacterium]|nr:hypothetical protein [Alphaproteobacteria bacterium]